MMSALIITKLHNLRMTIQFRIDHPPNLNKLYTLTQCDSNVNKFTMVRMSRMLFASFRPRTVICEIFPFSRSTFHFTFDQFFHHFFSVDGVLFFLENPTPIGLENMLVLRRTKCELKMDSEMSFRFDLYGSN